MNEPLIQAAYDYVRRGLSVIALTGKMPNGRVHPHGLKDALTGREGSGAAFRHPATTGVGILTGPTYYVVDIDGEEGARAWRDIAGDQWMPTRWVAKTGRGLHLWFADEHVWPTTKLGEKLDFKGLGGYVAAPPSAHPDGHTYEWLLEPGDEPPFEFPEGLLAHLNAAKFARERSKAKKVERQAFKETGLITNTPSFGGILERMKTAQPGERNNVLNWAAYTILSDGGGDDELQALAAVALETGMSSREVTRTINSAIEGAK